MSFYGNLLLGLVAKLMAYKCEKCGMVFETERELEIHLKLYHSLWAGEEWILYPL